MKITYGFFQNLFAMDYKKWYALLDASAYMKLAVDTAPRASFIWCAEYLYTCLRNGEDISIDILKIWLAPPRKRTLLERAAGLFGLGRPEPEMLSEAAKTNVRDYTKVLLRSVSGLKHTHARYPLWSNRRILTEMLLSALRLGGDASFDAPQMLAVLRGYWACVVFDVPGAAERFAAYRVGRGEYRITREMGLRVFYGRGPRRREVVVMIYDEDDKLEPKRTYYESPILEPALPIGRHLDAAGGYFCGNDAAVMEILAYAATHFP